MFMHTPPPPPPKPVPITIFVHGTQMHALFSDVDMRSFLPPVSQTPAGLTAAKDLSKEHLVRYMLNSLSTADPHQFPLEGLYTFGWSGSIHVQERSAAGESLFKLISDLSKQYQELHNKKPEITVISHSHGANVVLHMAGCENPTELRIKRSILLACPVQEITAHYAHDPLFEQVYSIHSHDDMIQVMDQESLQVFRSLFEVWKQNRQKMSLQDTARVLRSIIQNNTWKFGSSRHFGPRDNLLQVTVDWSSEPNHLPHHIEKGFRAELILYTVRQNMGTLKNFGVFLPRNRGVMHTEFTTPIFFSKLPMILKDLEQNTAQFRGDSDCTSYSIAG